MKKFKCLLAALLLVCSTASFAQSDVEAWKGIRFSYDHTFVNVDIDGYDAEDYNGFSIGYDHAFKIAKKQPIFFQTGLGINFARYSKGYEGYDYSSNLLGLNIPLNFVYGVQINDKLALKPYTGFYLRINLMGKGKYTYDDPDIEDEDYSYYDEDEMGDEKWNRCQFGWQVGTTLDISNFNVGIAYGIDFNEIAEKTRCGAFSVRLGYNF